MRGHIAKKGNRYYVVIYEGIDPATGKGRHRWHAAGPTRKGAERLLVELVKRHHDGEYRPPQKITLGEYLERWLPTQKARLAARRSPRTNATSGCTSSPISARSRSSVLCLRISTASTPTSSTMEDATKAAGRSARRPSGWCTASSTRHSPTPTARDR